MCCRAHSQHWCLLSRPCDPHGLAREKTALEMEGGFWSYVSQTWRQPQPPQAKPITDGDGEPWQALD